MKNSNKFLLACAALFCAALVYAQTFSFDEPQGIKYVLTDPANGEFPGQIIVNVGDAQDPIMKFWNQNDSAWEDLGGDAATMTATDLTLDTDGQLIVDDGSASAPGIAGALDADTGLRIGSGNITYSVAGSSAAIMYASAFTLPSSTQYIGLNNNLHRIQMTTKTVTATQLRTLAASPVSVVAAPGADYAVLIHNAVLSYRGGSNVFDSVGAGEDLALRYTDGSGTIVSTTVDTTSDVNFGSVTDDDILMDRVGAYKPTINAAVVLDNVGGGELATTDDDSDGDGVVYLEVFYSVVYLTP